MRLTQANLLDGEVAVESKNANCVVRLSEVGLRRLPHDLGLKLVGMGGKEALGGKLHVTNYRLVFRSHAFNRATGCLSIFLPSIVNLQDGSRGIVKRLVVHTSLQSVEFIVWGVPGLIATIDQQRGGRMQSQTRLLAAVSEHPEALGEGFKISKTMDLLVASAGNFGDAISSLASDPLSAASMLSLWELANTAAQTDE